MTWVHGDVALFTRGAVSIRVYRATEQDGAVRLLVEGPGPGGQEYHFDDLTACLTFQARMEARWVTDGYQLFGGAADRRMGADRQRTTFERRR